MAKSKEEVAKEIQALLKENGFTFNAVKKFQPYGDEYTMEIHVIDESQQYDFSPKGVRVWHD